ncbi:MAG: hypothetical protein J6D30_00805 [Clostridia bacterium]|nr:hypothetical protein [Clostridia bacterium]
MWKALLKKQWAETLAFFTLDRAKNKRRSPAATFGFAALMVYAFVSMVMLMWELSGTLCAPLMAAEMGWMYFALIGIMAMSLGVGTGAFMAKNKLYDAKDNDALLSMPIPTWMILCNRIFELYIFTFFIENVIFLPAVVRYLTVAGMRLPSIFGCFALCILLPLVSVSLCCLLGWALAWLSKKMPDNHIVAIVFSLAFLAAYFWAASQINTWITDILANPTEVQDVLQNKLYPFWQMGLAAEGNLLSLLIFIAMVATVFALIYFGISKTYVRFLTVKTSRKQARVKQKEGGVHSLRVALLQKEFRRFFKSYGYMLNSGTGVIMLFGVSIYSLFSGSFLEFNADMVTMLGLSGDKISYLVALIVCALSAMNFITACSVSLEGENIWVLQTMPIKEWDILFAKLSLHCLLTLPGTLFCGVSAAILLQADGASILAVVLGCVYVLFTAVLGLIINLKFPDLHWTNETVAVKQGVSTLCAMLGNMATVFILVGGYFLFGQYLQTWLYLTICVCLLVAAMVMGVLWLQKRGAKIFRSLS